MASSPEYIGYRNHNLSGLTKPENDVIFAAQRRMKEAKLKDPTTTLIDLTVGYLRTDEGEILKPQAIRTAERLLYNGRPSSYQSPEYLSPGGELEWPGVPAFIEGATQLVFGEQAEDLLQNNLLAAAGAEGGTHAIAVWARTQKLLKQDAAPHVLIAKPTWGNHHTILKDEGCTIEEYLHITAEGRFNMQGLMSALDDPRLDAVILQTGPAHNPTGVNPTTAQEWQQIAMKLRENDIAACLDTAYAGLASGNITEDAKAIRIFTEEDVPFAAAISFSKIGGLYDQRVGALLAPADSREERDMYQYFINRAQEGNILSPSRHGEAVMANVFKNPRLLQAWKKDVGTAANLLIARRSILAEEAPEVAQYLEGSGMFAILQSITPEHTQRLEEEFGVYLVPTPMGARINIGGLTADNISHVASGLRHVLNS